MKLRQGNVFTPVCHSVHGGCLADIPQQMATVADGTHPTGMHSCFHCCHLKFSFFQNPQIPFAFECNQPNGNLVPNSHGIAIGSITLNLPSGNSVTNSHRMAIWPITLKLQCKCKRNLSYS